MLRKYCIVASALCLLPVHGVFADTKYVCTHNNAVRTIEVHYVDADSKVPCEVIYTKESEEPRVVWNAQAEEGYCEARASEFVTRQEGWGWSCAEEKGEMAEPAAE